MKQTRSGNSISERRPFSLTYESYSVGFAHTMVRNTLNWHIVLAVWYLPWIIFLGCSRQEIRRTRSTSPGPLQIDMSSLDLGALAEQDVVQHSFTVRNATSSPFEDVELVSDCRCTDLTPATFAIEPHGEVRVNATLNFSLGSSDPAKVVEDMVVTIAAVSAKENIVLGRWELKAAVERTVVLSNSKIRLGVYDDYNQAEGCISVHVHRRLNNVIANCKNSQWFDVRLDNDLEQQRSKYACYSLRVRPTTREPTGVFNSVVEIVGTTSRDERVTIALIPVQGERVTDVTFTPAHVVFGTVAVGSTCKDTVRISSKSRSALSLISATPSSSAILCDFSKNEELVSLVVDIRAKPHAAGPRVEHVDFAVGSAQHSNPILVRVPVQYHAEER